MIAPAAASAQARHDPAPHAQDRPQTRTTVRTTTRTTTTTSRGNYGSWNNNWGTRPSAPTAAYKGRHNDWYRHVRACQQRYRSYNSRTDTYTLRAGVNRRCTL